MATKFGTIGWCDLTVDPALTEQVRDFYAAVAGWTPQQVDVEGYSDWGMGTAEGEGVAGICNRRGPNANVPLAWILYILVPDLESSAATALERGATLVDRRDGFCILRDPAGAVFALYQPAEEVPPE